jgi:hypothetical protein
VYVWVRALFHRTDHCSDFHAEDRIKNEVGEKI